MWPHVYTNYGVWIIFMIFIDAYASFLHAFVLPWLQCSLRNMKRSCLTPEPHKHNAICTHICHPTSQRTQCPSSRRPRRNPLHPTTRPTTPSTRSRFPRASSFFASCVRSRLTRCARNAASPTTGKLVHYSNAFYCSLLSRRVIWQWQRSQKVRLVRHPRANLPVPHSHSQSARFSALARGAQETRRADSSEKGEHCHRFSRFSSQQLELIWSSICTSSCKCHSTISKWPSFENVF